LEANFLTKAASAIAWTNF